MPDITAAPIVGWASAHFMAAHDHLHVLRNNAIMAKVNSAKIKT